MTPFTRQRSRSVAALGETKLIAEIGRWLGTATPKAPAGIGDDCAILPGSAKPQLITVDPVIYGEHFDDSIPARAVAAKLFNRNLSDIAAMGGNPRAAVIALAMTKTVKIEWLRDFYRGLGNLARRHKIPILGGDVAHQPDGFTATMTFIGEAHGKRILTREGAKVGDWIFVTGRLGGSRREWHYKFSPRLLEGQWLAARGEVRSMMDVSDGVAKDIESLLPLRSRAALRESAIPISNAANLVSRDSSPSALEHALTDGEDYELLFTVARRTNPENFAKLSSARMGLPVTCIGQIVGAQSAPAFPDEINLSTYHGFEHLR